MTYMLQVDADKKVRTIYRLRRDTEASVISERNIYAGGKAFIVNWCS